MPASSEIGKPIDGKSLRPLLQGETWGWEPRVLLAAKKNQVSVRSQQFRLDATGKLFDITVDPGQTQDVSNEHPEVAARLIRLQKKHQAEMDAEFAKYADRPFTVGYEQSTTLPARDGIEHEPIKRSAKPPNNSFFTNWTSEKGSITWDVDVVREGEYEAIVYYTCAEGNEGVTVKLAMDNDRSSIAKAKVVEVFDPPLYDKSKERVKDSHYFVKDFNPLSLGKLHLKKGRGVLRLSAEDIQGPQVIDVHSIELLFNSKTEPSAQSGLTKPGKCECGTGCAAG